MPTPPDDKRCRATTKGAMVLGRYWASPKRCDRWARDDGYCWQHQAEAERSGDRDGDQAADDA